MYTAICRPQDRSHAQQFSENLICFDLKRDYIGACYISIQKQTFIGPEKLLFLDSRSLPVNPLVKGSTKVDEQVRHQC
jgi:hypothetical protein